MADLQESIQHLKNWKKHILKVLLGINDIQAIRGKDLEQLMTVVTEFHREIGRAKEEEVDAKWFEYTLNLKKKLKKWQ